MADVLLSGNVWEVVKVRPVGLISILGPPGRNPDGVETIWAFARTALIASAVTVFVPPGRRNPCGFGEDAFLSGVGIIVRVIVGVIMNTSSSPRFSSRLPDRSDILLVG